MSIANFFIENSQRINELFIANLFFKDFWWENIGIPVESVTLLVKQ